jgi:hypothetical protein
MRAAKMMRRSIFFGGVLSLVLVPAFAGGSYGGSQEKGTTGKKEMHGHWFQKMDKDGDGKISQEEFQEATKKKFKRMDSDNDGSITKEEWQAAAKKWKEKHHKKGHYRSGNESSEGHDMEGM